MAEDRLTKDDLVLLMESYRNMITMHQTILDQTNKTIDKIDNIATKQDSLFSKQSNVYTTINSIKNKIDSNSIEVKENTSKVDNLSTNVIEKMNSHETKAIDSYGKLTNKIYIGWVGMITIILSLIGLGVTLVNLIQNYLTVVTP